MRSVIPMQARARWSGSAIISNFTVPANRPFHNPHSADDAGSEVFRRAGFVLRNASEINSRITAPGREDLSTNEHECTRIIKNIHQREYEWAISFFPLLFVFIRANSWINLFLDSMNTARNMGKLFRSVFLRRQARCIWQYPRPRAIPVNNLLSSARPVARLETAAVSRFSKKMKGIEPQMSPDSHR